MMNSSVITFFMLIICYDYTENQLWKLVLPINGFAWTMGILLATLPLTKESYNCSGYLCGFLAGFPEKCLRDEHIECIRGGDVKFDILWRSLEMGIYGLSLVVGILNLTLIYCSVRKIEDRAARYHFHDADSVMVSVSASISGGVSCNASTAASTQINRSKSHSVALQAYWYTGLYFTTFFIFCITVATGSFQLWCFQTTVLILVGFFNAAIYSRNREMKTAEGRAFRSLVWCSSTSSTPTTDRRHREFTNNHRHRHMHRPPAEINNVPVVAVSQNPGSAVAYLTFLDNRYSHFAMGAVRSDEDLTFDHDESGADSQDDGIVHRLLTFPADQSQKEDEEEVVLKEVLKSANNRYLRQSSAGL